MAFFLSVMGMVLIVEGIPYLCFPASVKTLAQRLLDLDDNFLRNMGLLITITGLIVVYIGRRVIS